MISLKRLIESNQEELIAGALRAYRSALDCIGRASFKASPTLGAPLQDSLIHLQRQIPDHAPLETIEQTQSHVEAQVDQWGDRMAAYYRRKTDEFKEILLMMARTAECVGDRDKRYSDQFTAITSRLQSVATMDELSEIRDAVAASATQLRGSVERMTQDGEAIVSHMRGQLRLYQAKLEEAERLASIDGLTGIQNRRGIESILASLLTQGAAFAVALFDLNGFKQINDTHGHAAGDDVLRQFASELRSAFRSTDDVGRWGGDEFIVILRCGLEDATRHVERARRWVLGEYTLANACPPLKLPVDAAIGLAALEAGDTLATLLARADADMYRKKLGGAGPPARGRPPGRPNTF